MDLSVVIPVRNEEKNLPVLIERLIAALSPRWPDFEVLFVTDLNSDRTFEVLCAWNDTDPRIKTVKLSNGFGQHVAILAGLARTSGEFIILMDGDLQDFPEDIPLLVDKQKEGPYDIVYGIKDRKNDTGFRNFASKLFNKFMRALSDVKIDANTSMFRLLSRRTVHEVLRFQEQEPSLTYIFSLINFPTAHVRVQSGDRAAGETKYSFFRLVNFAVSSLVSFSRKPMRFISGLGFVVSALSLCYLLFELIRWAVSGSAVQGWTTLVILVAFLGGVQLISIGILGEYVGRTFIEAKKRPLYFVECAVGRFTPPEEAPE